MIESNTEPEKFNSLRQRCLSSIFLSANVIQNQLNSTLKSYGLTPQQFNFLRILRGSSPVELCLYEIKERLIDKNADVSRLMNRLLQKDLIQYRVSPNDRRQKFVSLSDKGIQILNLIDQKHPDFPYSLLNGLENSDLEKLCSFLEQVLKPYSQS
jgi:DNA-binding MarR family transcriptional regulator